MILAHERLEDRLLLSANPNPPHPVDLYPPIRYPAYIASITVSVGTISSNAKVYMDASPPSTSMPPQTVTPTTPTFSANGTNAAKNTTATFHKAGYYDFQVTIEDASSLTTTSTVSVEVKQTLTSIVVFPNNASLHSGNSFQFAAVGYDQFGYPMSHQPNFKWTKTFGLGAIGQTGLFELARRVPTFPSVIPPLPLPELPSLVFPVGSGDFVRSFSTMYDEPIVDKHNRFPVMNVVYNTPPPPQYTNYVFSAIDNKSWRAVVDIDFIR